MLCLRQSEKISRTSSFSELRLPAERLMRRHHRDVVRAQQHRLDRSACGRNDLQAEQHRRQLAHVDVTGVVIDGVQLPRAFVPSTSRPSQIAEASVVSNEVAGSGIAGAPFQWVSACSHHSRSRVSPARAR